MDAHIPSSLIPSILIAHLLPWYFFGVLSVQFYFYSKAALQDRLPTKALIYIVYALQISQIVLFANESFSFFVWSRTVADILAIRSTWFSIVVNVGLVACCVQLFYAWRIYIISRTRVPAICVLMMSFISLAFCLAAGVKYKAGVNILSEFDWEFLLLVRMSLATNTVCDITIAGLMILYLKRYSPAEFRFQNTIDVVNRIIRLYVETGTLTACAGFLTFLVICIPSHPPWFIVLGSTISGVYTTTLMTVINSRIKPVACTINGSYIWPEDYGHLKCGQMRDLWNGDDGGGELMVFEAMSHPTASVLSRSALESIQFMTIHYNQSAIRQHYLFNSNSSIFIIQLRRADRHNYNKLCRTMYGRVGCHTQTEQADRIGLYISRLPGRGRRCEGTTYLIIRP